MRWTGRPSGMLLRMLLHAVAPENREWTAEALRQLQPAQRPVSVSLRQAVSALRHGFYPKRYHILRLDERRRREHLLSDRDSRRINAAVSAVVMPTQDKLLLSVLFGDVPDAACRLLGFVSAGHFLPVGPGPWGTPALLGLLAEGPVVVKPSLESGGGRGVVILSGEPRSPVVNGAPISPEALDSLLRNEHKHSVVTTYARHGAYAEQIMPRHPSKVRLMTVRDEEERPYLAWAAHVFATRRSGSSLTFGAGAISAEIDRVSGRLSAGVSATADGRVARHSIHPDTQKAIEGVVVPHWGRLTAAILGVAARMPHVKLVGWDVIATDEGPTIIEGEAHAFTSSQQVHRPLLADPVVVRFLRREGLLTENQSHGVTAR